MSIAALSRLIDAAEVEPMKPTLLLRSLLAFLYVHSDGDRRPYDDLWQVLHEQSDREDSDSAASYVRRTYARTHYGRINRGLSGARAEYGIDDAVASYLRQQREADDPAERQRRLLAEGIREAALEREIISSKGHPRTEAGQDKMRRMGMGGRIPQRHPFGLDDPS